MPRVLVAGCGYVGEAAADFFHASGWEVEGWTGSAASADRLSVKPYPVRALDITDASVLSGVNRDVDVLIQCASTRGGPVEEYRRVYLRGTEILRAIFPAAKHLFTSSTSVYGQQNGEIVDEKSPANPLHEKGRVLRVAEELVLEGGGIVGRIGAIYGPCRSFLLRSFFAGKSVVEQGNDRFLNQVHRDDIVAALFLLAERRAEVGGEIFNVVDDEPMLASKAVQWLSERLDQPLPLGTGPILRKRGATNKQVSNRKLRERGWQLCFPNFRVGMRQSVFPSFGL